MSAGFRGSLEPLRSLHKLRDLYLFGCVALEGSVEPLSGLQALVAVDRGGLLRAGWRARPPCGVATTPVRQRLRYAA